MEPEKESASKRQPSDKRTSQVGSDFSNDLVQ